MSKNVSSADKKRYELMLILNPDLGEDGIKNRLDEIRGHLKKESSAEIFHEEDWGIRDLAYSIKNQKQGYYFLMDYACDPSGILELNKMLLLEPEVLRHLVTVLPLNYVPKDYKKEAEEAALAAQEATPDTKKISPTPEKDTSKKSETTSFTKKPSNFKKSGEPDSKLANILENPDLNF